MNISVELVEGGSAVFRDHNNGRIDALEVVSSFSFEVCDDDWIRIWRTDWAPYDGCTVAVLGARLFPPGTWVSVRELQSGRIQRKH